MRQHKDRAHGTWVTQVSTLVCRVLLIVFCPQPFPLGSETYIGREKCISCVHSFICSLAFVQCLWTLGPRISQYKRKMDMQKIIVTMVPNVLKLS